MKKILSLLSTISLSTIISTNVIACNKTSKNNKPIKPKFIPQQPPKNNNGKLIDNSLINIKKEFNKYNNKGYFIIGKKGNNENGIGESMFFKYDESAPRMTGAGIDSIKSIYCGDGIDKPITLKINNNIGEIINGN